MASEVTREEFESRIGVVEREVEGKKLVTRHILEQTRRNSDDLSAVKTRLDRVERKVDGVAQDVGVLRRTLDGLVRDLPKIVSDAVRGRERKK